MIAAAVSDFAFLDGCIHTYIQPLTRQTSPEDLLFLKKSYRPVAPIFLVCLCLAWQRRVWLSAIWS
jgi:hypothetical protein